MAHTISFTDAKTLISNFLNDPTLGSIGKNESLGGLIDMRNLDLNTYGGGCFWHCWNTEYIALPKFFLAFEDIDYDSNAPDDMSPRSSWLTRSYGNYLFRYPYDSNSTSQVDTFLKNQTKEWDQSKHDDLYIDMDTVIELNTNFESHFPYNGSGNPYNKNTFGFFDGAEITSFIQQGPYLRYFYGLQDRNTNNKIKIILIAVDNTGHNIWSGGAVMMEHAWPP